MTNMNLRSIEERDTLAAQIKEKTAGTGKKSDGKNEDVNMNELSDLSDISASEGASEASGKGGKAKDLRRKAQSQAHAKQREAARAHNASLKQAIAKHRTIEEELAKIERKLESIEREFRKLLGSIRVKAMGRDRFYNRIWWFDGMGAASLIGSGGAVQYGSGRLFVQGPSQFDQEILDRRNRVELEERRLREEGPDGILKPGEWAVYTDIDEVSQWSNCLDQC